MGGVGSEEKDKMEFLSRNSFTVEKKIITNIKKIY